MPKTSKIDPRTLPKAFGDTNGLHERSGASQDHLGAVLGAFPGGLGAPQGALGAPRGVPRAILGCPGRVLDRPGGVLAASWGVPESPQGAPEAPRSILERILLDCPSLRGRRLDFAGSDVRILALKGSFAPTFAARALFDSYDQNRQSTIPT